MGCHREYAIEGRWESYTDINYVKVLEHGRNRR